VVVLFFFSFLDLDESLLDSTVEENDKMMMMMLIDKNSENNYHYRGFTPLHFACEFNQYVAGAILVECGADVNKRTKNGELFFKHTRFEFNFTCSQPVLSVILLVLNPFRV
jgi:hypothetical protein